MYLKQVRKTDKHEQQFQIQIDKRPLVMYEIKIDILNKGSITFK